MKGQNEIWVDNTLTQISIHCPSTDSYSLEKLPEPSFIERPIVPPCPLMLPQQSIDLLGDTLDLASGTSPPSEQILINKVKRILEITERSKIILLFSIASMKFIQKDILGAFLAIANVVLEMLKYMQNRLGQYLNKLKGKKE